MSFRQARYDEPLLFEYRSRRLRSEVDESLLPHGMARKDLDLPDLEEHEVVRHFTRLSQMNFGIDSGFYPLGSCTMKYNPKFNEEIARLDGVRRIHPHQDVSTIQGAIQVLYELQRMLCVISGMDAASLQPAAGAHGEWTCLLVARAYHEGRGEDRTEVVVPDTAHGTNLASAAMAGFDVVEIPSKEGVIDLKALEKAVNHKTAAFMHTNPNTLGIFESDVLKIAKVVHAAGALLYYDGANLNAILGKTNPGKMQFDMMHFNLHKTFSTPHGGGGPGAGPVAVKAPLAPYLPLPLAAYDGKRYYWDYDRPKSIGKVRAWHGNFALLLRAYAYILRHGGSGLTRNAERAVVNANYLRKKLNEKLDMPFRELRKHEFVVSGGKLKKKGLRTMDVAKRLMDYGFHPPTVYFPQLVEEALMVEPTETETKETLDRFAEALKEIVEEEPEVVKGAPHNAAVARVDEVLAARKPILSWRMYAKERDARIDNKR